MARLRLSDPAKADIAAILLDSEARHGMAARARYSALLAAALRNIATAPRRASSAARDELLPGLRSYHLRHAREDAPERIGAPVHVVFYRAREPGLVEIVRVLHERMDPLRHMEVRKE